MKLYVCWGAFPIPEPGGHPCSNAHKALRDAGHSPQVLRAYGLGILPRIFNLTKGRQEVEKLTGNRMVPTLVLDDGTVIDGSKEIVSWARANPAKAPVA